MSGPPAKPKRKGQYWWLVLCFFIPFVMVGTYSAMHTAVKRSHIVKLGKPEKPQSFKEVLQSQASETVQSSRSSEAVSLLLPEAEPPKLTSAEIEEDAKEQDVFMHNGTVGGSVGLILGILGIIVSFELKKRAAAKKL